MMIGHLLGGRYEIIERVGGGGMALVYKAQDILLNRYVAVKVLRQQFVHDEEFIRRFRREAQSAASLSHPNVVSIYDVGQEDEVHYIVMEYVEGQNLNEIIKERAPLQVDEAVRIASQICDALEHAHQSQIIHRDIKPHNILIGRNGRVKVTDFGIARAVTSTTITQTGSVVGSVHYFSPEHAKGITTGEKSDLYSLGIVLYQMLTAQLPFLGESPISVALKHLQEEFEEPRRVNPLIPQSVENVILKSMRKNPDERYQSADEMLADLETCLLPERRNEPKAEFYVEEDVEQTRIIPAIKPHQQGMSQRNGGGRDSLQEMKEDTALEQPKKKKRLAFWVTLTLVVLALMAVLVIVVDKAFEVSDVKVPNLVTQTEEQARATLAAQGLKLADPVLQEYKEGIEPGIIFKQSQPEGALVKEGSLIQVTVGTEKPLTPMPSVTGQSYDDAVSLLVSKGITEDRIKQKQVFDDSADEGTVTDQIPAANEEFNPDEVQVTLSVSKGSETIAMPDLTNKSRAEAEKELSDAKLKLVSVKEETSYEIEQGKVTKQWPFEPGADVAPGSEITIYVSTGYPPEAIKVPFQLPLVPAEEGKNAKIKVTVTDARGDNQDWGTRTLNTTQIVTVDLLLRPNKDAVVSVTRDGKFVDNYIVTYVDAKNGTVQMPQVAPPASTEPEVPPVEEEADPAVTPEQPDATGGENGGETIDPSAMNNGNGTNSTIKQASQHVGRGNGNGNGNDNGNGNGNN